MSKHKSTSSTNMSFPKTVEGGGSSERDPRTRRSQREAPVIYSHYVPAPSVPLHNEGPSKTRQEDAEKCNINFIIARYQKTGQLDHINAKVPQYGDFSMVEDLSEIFDKARNVEAWFLTLPAKVREAASHDSVEFFAMLATTDGVEALEAAGLDLSGLERSDQADLEHFAKGDAKAAPSDEQPAGDAGGSEARGKASDSSPEA